MTCALMITPIKAGIKLEEGEATGAGEITLPLKSKVEPGKHFLIFLILLIFFNREAAARGPDQRHLPPLLGPGCQQLWRSRRRPKQGQK